MKAFAGKHFLLIVENNSVPFDRRVWREALALREQGAEISVISPADAVGEKKSEVIDSVHVYRYRPSFSLGSKTGYISEYSLAFLKTLFLFHKIWWERGFFHVVHVANPPDIYWPLALYCKLLKFKFIFDEHDLTPETLLSLYGLTETEGGFFYRVLREFQYLSYKFADAVISTNETYKRKAIERYPKNQQKLFIVRNGPDTRQFREVAPNDALRRGHKYLLAYIGIMAVQDGVEYIIRAVRHLVKERDFEDFIVYLIGSGNDLSRLIKLTKDLGLENKIVFTGRIPDKPALEILSTSDICLSPDPSNPLNDSSTMNKIMEYMTLGKPIVSFNLHEAKYSAEEAALYVSNNDASAFGEGILALIKDKKRRSLMGQHGKARVEEKLSWQKQILDLIKAYDHVLRDRTKE